MRLSSIYSLAFVATTQIYTTLAQDKPDPSKIIISGPAPGSINYQGCFKSVGDMEPIQLVGQFVGNTFGSCSQACLKKKATLMAMEVKTCYCGKTMPPKDDMESSKGTSHCLSPCDGFHGDACGSNGYSAVFNLGIDTKPPTDKSKSSKTSSSSSTTSKSSKDSSKTDAASQSSPAETSVVTQTAPVPTQDKDSEGKKKSGPNTAGIAAGVVVGVVVVAAIIGGLVFFMRRKRNAEIEEEHRRNAAVNAFISGSKPPSSHGSISMTDSRLDPVMAHRRMSDGSIADNEDYSRRILRVTNA